MENRIIYTIIEIREIKVSKNIGVLRNYFDWNITVPSVALFVLRLFNIFIFYRSERT